MAGGTDYHYVITIQSPMPMGLKVGMYTGTYVLWPSGRTRKDVFHDRFNYACTQLGSNPADTYVMHWSLEPNDLDKED